MSAEEIVDKLQRQSSVRRVVISGGEPTLQIDANLLMALRMAGFEIHLETNGSRPLGELRSFIEHVTMSPKQSFEDTKLEWADDLKILYPGPSPDITMEKFAAFSATNRYLQPVWDQDYKANLKAAVCRVLGNPDWKLSLQTHKIIGVE